MTLTMEPAGLAAAEVFAAVHARAVDDPWAREAFAETLGMAGVTGLLALSDAGDPTGFIVLRQVLDEAEVILIAVDHGARRQGIARHLLRHALGLLNGATRVFLEVAEDNSAAIALYRGVGFSDVGRRRGYYARPDGAATDAIVLGISLPFPCR